MYAKHYPPTFKPVAPQNHSGTHFQRPVVKNVVKNLGFMATTPKPKEPQVKGEPQEHFYEPGPDYFLIAKITSAVLFLLLLVIVWLGKQLAHLENKVAKFFVFLEHKAVASLSFGVEYLKRDVHYLQGVENFENWLNVKLEALALAHPNWAGFFGKLGLFNIVDLYTCTFFILIVWFGVWVLVELVEFVIDFAKEHNHKVYCINKVPKENFHNKEFTNSEVAKLMRTPEYQRLKSRRAGQGPESWNWQLLKSKTSQAGKVESDVDE